MYLDMGNMKSYNKSHGCEQPYVPNYLFPLSVSFIYIYLILSALVPVSAQMILLIALMCCKFTYWFVTTRARSFPVRLDREI